MRAKSAGVAIFGGLGGVDGLWLMGMGEVFVGVGTFEGVAE